MLAGLIFLSASELIIDTVLLNPALDLMFAKSMICIGRLYNFHRCTKVKALHLCNRDLSIVVSTKPMASGGWMLSFRAATSASPFNARKANSICSAAA
mmetsp:Transcript_36737/g.72110  ORF Transcript_36737/g.72110 Transcript_36737/m.72110 type:complete len:98 (-) Transcript_36737:96-389(-)